MRKVRRMKEKQRRGVIRAGRQPQSHPERGTGVPPVNVANLGTSSKPTQHHRSTRPRRPCPLFPFTLPPHFPAELPQSVESMKQKFDNRSRSGGLTDPEKEHPLDDFGFHFSPVLFGHQSFGEILFLLVKSEFQACGNSSGFWGLNIRGFQNTKNLCGAHGKKFSKCLIPFVASVHSNLFNHFPPLFSSLFHSPSFLSLN